MKTAVPAEYAKLRRELATPEISLGYSGLALVPLEAIPEAQLGYAVIPKGETTDWKESWLVVGRDTSLGDHSHRRFQEKASRIYRPSWRRFMVAEDDRTFGTGIF